MARKIADHTWKMSLPKYVSRKEFSTRLKRWAHNSRDTSASKNCAKVSTFSMYGNFSESGKWTIKPFHLYVPTLFCARFFSSLSEKKNFLFKSFWTYSMRIGVEATQGENFSLGRWWFFPQYFPVYVDGFQRPAWERKCIQILSSVNSPTCYLANILRNFQKFS